jgi:hypothetical protein
VELLIALAVLFFSFPFVEERQKRALIVSILFSLVLLSSVFAVADRKCVPLRQIAVIDPSRTKVQYLIAALGDRLK